MVTRQLLPHIKGNILFQRNMLQAKILFSSKRFTWRRHQKVSFSNNSLGLTESDVDDRHICAKNLEKIRSELWVCCRFHPSVSLLGDAFLFVLSQSFIQHTNESSLIILKEQHSLLENKLLTETSFPLWINAGITDCSQLRRSNNRKVATAACFNCETHN